MLCSADNLFAREQFLYVLRSSRGGIWDRLRKPFTAGIFCAADRKKVDGSDHDDPQQLSAKRIVVQIPTSSGDAIEPPSCRGWGHEALMSFAAAIG